MIWLFILSVGLLIASMLMTPLYKLLAPAWAARPALKRTNTAVSQPGRLALSATQSAATGPGDRPPASG